jgi:hypothetical protein
LSLSKHRLKEEEDASLSAVKQEGETSGFDGKFIGKTTKTNENQYALRNSDGASSSSIRLSTGGWEAARARHKESASGHLLDEGAADKLRSSL